MILVDTSVWVDHLREGDEGLIQLLNHGQVFMHPMIMGELACGHLHNREQLLELWQKLPAALEASHEEAMFLLESHSLMGRGIGWIDLHLLTSVHLMPSMKLWTRDKRLADIAKLLGVSF